MSSNPVAWMHTIHMEDGQTAVRLARAEIDRPWGKPGVDFDQSYSVTIEPLYTRPSPDRLAVAYIQREVLDVLAKDKTATGTVCSGLIQKPFGNPVPLYTNPAQPGWRLVPKEPSRGRLISMAIRDNHAFLINPDPNAAWTSGVKPENREAILRSMRQLYEEAIGEGFYSPDKEEGYIASYEKAQALAKEGR